jgi:hypothetical protein
VPCILLVELAERKGRAAGSTESNAVVDTPR